MAEATLCPLCTTRAPRRACPALDQAICAPCCGAEREQSVACPLECEYLRAARVHDKPAQADLRDLPNREIEVSERFLAENERLVVVLGRLLLVAAMETESTVDYDMRDAIAAMIATYKSASSGLIYESKPENAIAARVAERFQTDATRFRDDVAKQAAEHAITDAQMLGVLVFWQRMEFRTNNQRRKGRSFIESLFSLLPRPTAEAQAETPEPTA